jgi:peptidylprolyl isomerase
LALEKKDFVIIDYTAKVKETGKVFDTTVKEIAEKEGFKNNESKQSKLIIVGEGWIMKAVDDSLTKLEVDKSLTVEVPPERAFGPRDVSKIRVVPLKQITEKGISPKVGMMLEYSGQTAIVRSVESGRVMLDLNHILAGKTLVYEVVLKKKLETSEEKILALVSRRIPTIEESKFIFSIEQNAVTVKLPREALPLDGIQNAKRGISSDIERFFPEVTSVVFVEIFEININIGGQAAITKDVKS